MLIDVVVLKVELVRLLLVGEDGLM